MVADLSKILFKRIEELREESGGKIEINNIDSLVRSIIEALKSYITTQNDLNIYNEITNIYNQINTLKKEVLTVQPGHLSKDFIPGATSE